jgi:hypothetical protein
MRVGISRVVLPTSLMAALTGIMEGSGYLEWTKRKVKVQQNLCKATCQQCAWRLYLACPTPASLLGLCKQKGCLPPRHGRRLTGPATDPAGESP